MPLFGTFQKDENYSWHTQMKNQALVPAALHLNMSHSYGKVLT